MRLLLDTHVVLWVLDEPGKLSREAAESITDGANQVVVSAANAWEIAIKSAAGRLQVPDGFMRRLAEERFDVLDISPAHALTAGGLPPHHKDPFDRMLVAQAQIEGLTLVTRDEKLDPYQVAVLRA